MPDFGPGDRVRCSADSRASGPSGPLGETRRVIFEGVVTAVEDDTVLVRVGRTDVRCPASSVALLAKGGTPEPARGSSAAPPNAAATLDKFLEDARRIGANLKQLNRP